MLLLTLAGTAAAFVKLPATYESVSSIVFLAPKNVAKVYGGNPYLAFNSTLNQTADVVRYETMDERTVNALAARGYTSTYLVTDAIDTSGPVLVVTVTGHNKVEVEHSLYGVTAEVSARLSALQAGLTQNNKVTDVVITFMTKPSVLSSKKSRPLTVVAGLGLMMTVGIPLIVDSVITKRRSRKAGAIPREMPAAPQASHQAYQPYGMPAAKGNGTGSGGAGLAGAGPGGAGSSGGAVRPPRAAGVRVPGDVVPRGPRDTGSRNQRETAPRGPGEAGPRGPGDAGPRNPGEAGTRAPREAGSLSRSPREGGQRNVEEVSPRAHPEWPQDWTGRKP
jgi:hypothetical protein